MDDAKLTPVQHGQAKNKIIHDMISKAIKAIERAVRAAKFDKSAAKFANCSAYRKTLQETILPYVDKLDALLKKLAEPKELPRSTTSWSQT